MACRCSRVRLPCPWLTLMPADAATVVLSYCRPQHALRCLNCCASARICWLSLLSSQLLCTSAPYQPFLVSLAAAVLLLDGSSTSTGSAASAAVAAFKLEFFTHSVFLSPPL